MKIRNIITLILLFFISFYIYAQIPEYFKWGYANSIRGKEMHKIFAHGEDTVYIVGKDGMIAKSIDQAASWTYYYNINPVTLTDIVFVNINTGYAIGEQGVILKTTDAGKNWGELISGTMENLNAIAYTDANNIWVVGENSTILHSTNEGVSWQKINLFSTSIDLLDITFRGDLGYMTGNYGTVYKTEDKGTTWQEDAILENLDESYIMDRISLTENHVYIRCNLRYYYKKTMNVWSKSKYDSYYSGLTFSNDSMGYYIRQKLYTGVIYWGIHIYHAYYGGDYGWYDGPIEITGIPVDPNFGNLYRHDMFIVNENLGYAIMGEVLLRKPIPNFPSVLKKNEVDNPVTVVQKNDYLFIQSENRLILSVELIDAKHTIFFSQQLNKCTENIPIGELPAGIYFARITLSGGDRSVIKWIKY